MNILRRWLSLNYSMIPLEAFLALTTLQDGSGLGGVMVGEPVNLTATTATRESFSATAKVF